MQSLLSYPRQKHDLFLSGARLSFPSPRLLPKSFSSLSVSSTTALSFTIYPRHAADLELNRLLWRLIRTPLLDPVLIRRHLSLASAPSPDGFPFCLSIPPPLARFLETVSLQEMHLAVIYMLADAAQGEDASGLAEMRRELPTEIWDDVWAIVTADESCCGEEEDASGRVGHASHLLDIALSLTAATENYWRIPVTLRMMGADGEKGETAGVALSAWVDWWMYVEVCGGGEGKYGRGMEWMRCLNVTNRQGDVWQRVKEIWCGGGWFGCLPREVGGLVGGFVVGAEVEASQKEMRKRLEVEWKRRLRECEWEEFREEGRQ